MEEGRLSTASLSLEEAIRNAFAIEKKDIRTYSPLALAFLGDAVYSLAIRTLIVAKGNCGADRLHRESSALVKASAQAALAEAIRPLLTEEETVILRRGHNANPPHSAKNSSREDYLDATAVEALFGYLYLAGREDRILQLLKAGLDL